MKFESGPTNETSVIRLQRLLTEKILSEDFSLEEGETKEDVLQRGELLKAVLPELPRLAERVIVRYREILSIHGINTEQTGKLACLIVGGRVHNESLLKTYSDIDLIITAEKPFAATRSKKIELEMGENLPSAIPLKEHHVIANELIAAFQSDILSDLNETLSTKLGRTVDILNKETLDGGLIEIKGYGHQRIEDVNDSLVLYTE